MWVQNIHPPIVQWTYDEQRAGDDMNPTILSILSALAAAAWSVWTWQSEREKERELKRDEMSAQYVNTFMLATQELQRKLFKVLEDDELTHYRSHFQKRSRQGQRSTAMDLPSPIAIDLLYHLSVFYAWGLVTFVFGPYTRDSHMIALMGQMGEILESRKRFPGDAFRFTISDRVALGNAVVKRLGESSSRPLFSTVTRFKFEEEMNDESGENARLFASEQVRCSLAAVDRAVQGEPLEGRERLSALQCLLVELIEYLEEKEGFRVSLGERKRAGNQDTRIDVVFVGNQHVRVLHHVPGRVRLSVPELHERRERADELQSLLSSVDHVTGVRVNAGAESVVVEYSPETDLQKLIATITTRIENEFSEDEQELPVVTPRIPAAAKSASRKSAMRKRGSRKRRNK
jgi:hypothetical protein